MWTLTLLIVVGCGGQADTQPKSRTEPVPADLRMLRLEGISNPYGPRGQTRLRQLRGERELLEAARQQRRKAQGNRAAREGS